jgi:hypothetical protein
MLKKSANCRILQEMFGADIVKESVSHYNGWPARLSRPACGSWSGQTMPRLPVLAAVPREATSTNSVWPPAGREPSHLFSTFTPHGPTSPLPWSWPTPIASHRAGYGSRLRAPLKVLGRGRAKPRRDSRGISVFASWFAAARRSGNPGPTASLLSTITTSRSPPPSAASGGLRLAMTSTDSRRGFRPRWLLTRKFYDNPGGYTRETAAQAQTATGQGTTTKRALCHGQRHERNQYGPSR